MRAILALAGAILLAACNPVAQMNNADALIDRFHEQYGAGDYDAIYQASAPDFRRAVDQEEWGDFIRMVSGRLGAVEESSQTSVNVNSNNGLTTTTIIRSTSFEQGMGTETFVFQGSGEGMSLLNYEVVSDELVGATLNEGRDPAADETAKPSADGKTR